MIFSSNFWDVIIHLFVVVEMERLEGVKDEIPHVFIHVRVEYASVKVIDGAPSIHHLSGQEI